VYPNYTSFQKATYIFIIPLFKEHPLFVPLFTKSE
jgi:hypothetical protein